MKKLLLALASLALLFSCKNADTTVVNGKILGYAGEFTEFFIPEGEGFTEYPIDVKEDGSFSIKLDMKEDWWDAPLFVDKFMFRTVIQKGKTYNAEFDVTVPEVEDRFRFIGEGAAENEFARVYYNQFFYVSALLESIGETSSFADYSAKVKAKADECRTLMTAAGNPGLTEYYTPLIDAKEKEVSFYYPYKQLAQEGKVPEDADYEAFVKNSGLDELPADQVQAIFNGVAGYVAFLPGLNIGEAVKLAYGSFGKKSNAEFAATSILQQYMSAGNTDGLREAYEWYLQQKPAAEYVEQVESLYKATMALVAGSEAPEIELEDPAGNKVLLSSLRGKVLYIDFWATWCGPCQGEIPHMAKLAEKYKGNSKIALISISLDEDKAAWKAQIDEEKPIWAQYVLTEKGQKQVAEDYKITAIPRFCIIDAQGNIVNVNAARPSSASVEAEIGAALK